MWMPLACQRTLSAASAAYSRFDRTLLAACQWPPRNVLNTFSSRRARRAEARSGTHLCAQGVARSRVHRCRRSMRPCAGPSRSLTHSRWWRWAWACVNARGCAGRFRSPGWSCTATQMASATAPSAGLYMQERAWASRGCRRSARAPPRAAAGLATMASGSAPDAGPVSGSWHVGPPR